MLGILTAITLAVPFLGLPQPVTGPLVNAMLIMTAVILGPTGGSILGALTPVMALIRGQLPAPLAAMVPLIMAGNAVYVILFCFLYRRFTSGRESGREWFFLISLSVAATAKTMILLAGVRWILPAVLGRALPVHIAYLMTTPQLMTAVTGGILAMLILRLLERAAVL